MDSLVLEQLYRKYYRELYLYIYAICKNKSLAEDLLQETFLKAILALPSDHTNMRAWLYLVARNLTYNAMNKVRPLTFAPEKDFATEADTDPLNTILQKEQYRSLYESLQKLPKKSKEILILQYFGRLSHKEIAAVLRMSPAAVRMAAVRARKELKTYMEEEL